jgi:hypothetical protein
MILISKPVRLNIQRIGKATVLILASFLADKVVYPKDQNYERVNTFIFCDYLT